MNVDGHVIGITNRGKALFGEGGASKGDLIDYYRRIADTALPHYRDRPLTAGRFPDGIDAPGFFQKDIPGYFPDWIDRVELRKQGGSVTHVVVGDTATLVYLANQACITPHLALARRDRPGHPDRLIFDLDPSDDDFRKVQAAARQVRALLDDLEMASFPMLTGSRGLHVVVPLDRAGDFEAAHDFARQAARRLAGRHPDLLTVEHRKARRGDRVFVDYLRNAYGQTAAAPYAVRAKAGAPVATPLRWREALASDLAPRRYTIRNIFRRLAQADDPWAGIDRAAVALAVAQRRLAAVSEP